MAHNQFFLLTLLNLEIKCNVYVQWLSSVFHRSPCKNMNKALHHSVWAEVLRTVVWLRQYLILHFVLKRRWHFTILKAYVRFCSLGHPEIILNRSNQTYLNPAKNGRSIYFWELGVRIIIRWSGKWCVCTCSGGVCQMVWISYPLISENIFTCM